MIVEVADELSDDDVEKVLAQDRTVAPTRAPV